MYRQCKACHNAKKAVHSVGPHLVDLLGRESGSVEGFQFSPALQKANIVWSEESLAQFLANPAAAVPGNTMPFAGMGNPKDIDDLIAYLKSLK